MSATTAVILSMPGLAAAAVPALLGSADTLGDYLKTYAAVARENERRPCTWCQLEGHFTRWRGYPVLDPGPCPPGDVLDDAVEACACCFWGPSADPLYDRLSREAHAGRDVPVDHLGRDGRWTKFETRF